MPPRLEAEQLVQPGAQVCIFGLKNATQLNGQRGVIHSQQDERWAVKLDASGERVLVRKANLRPVLQGCGAERDDSDGAGTSREINGVDPTKLPAGGEREPSSRLPRFNVHKPLVPQIIGLRKQVREPTPTPAPAPAPAPAPSRCEPLLLLRAGARVCAARQPERQRHGRLPHLPRGVGDIPGEAQGAAHSPNPSPSSSPSFSSNPSPNPNPSPCRNLNPSPIVTHPQPYPKPHPSSPPAPPRPSPSVSPGADRAPMAAHAGARARGRAQPGGARGEARTAARGGVALQPGGGAHAHARTHAHTEHRCRRCACECECECVHGKQRGEG